MSGRLIILPKKTWNVWNREAIAKVRNDEKEHAEKEEAERQRQLRLDSEARVELLRRKRRLEAGGAGEAGQAAGKLQEGTGPRKAVEEASEPQAHINFFEDIERAVGTNEEHAKEKRAKEMQEMKRMGIAPLALGAGSVEASEDKPWYQYTIRGQEAPARSRRGTVLEGDEAKRALEKQDQHKTSQDPMASLVKSHALPAAPADQRGAPLGLLPASSSSTMSSESREASPGRKKKKKRKKDEKKRKKRSRDDNEDSSSSDEDSDDSRRKKKHKKHKKHHRRYRSRSPPQDPKTSVEALRAKRQKREAMERARTALMMTKHATDGEEREMIQQHAGRQAMKYNQQFHPELARRR